MGCLSGEWDETEVNICVVKEHDYNIIMMSTCSILTVPAGQKEKTRIVLGEAIKFNYPAFFSDHYRYREVVENHNALRYDGGTKSQTVL